MRRLPYIEVLLKTSVACAVLALAPPAARSAATAAPLAPTEPTYTVQPGDAEPVPALLDDAALEALVGPVALYPDDLLSIVLPAATYPLQVVQAARFLDEVKQDPSLKPPEDWDDAVVALLNYPEVVQLMDDDLDWTWKLGEAVLNQEADVLTAVTRFRNKAATAGNLKTDDKQIVEVTDDAVEIRPADPKVIYVPYYEPERVIVYQPAPVEPVYYYYPIARPVYYYPYPVDYGFASGYFWGVTTAFGIGWSTHNVFVHNHYHYRHPYYGYHYDHHYYYRAPRYRSPHYGRPYPYAGRDGARQDPYHWRPNRDRAGARPAPIEGRRDDRRHNRQQQPRTGGGRQGVLAAGRMVDGRHEARPGNPFARQSAAAFAGDTKTTSSANPARNQRGPDNRRALTNVTATGGEPSVASRRERQRREVESVLTQRRGNGGPRNSTRDVTERRPPVTQQGIRQRLAMSEHANQVRRAPQGMNRAPQATKSERREQAHSGALGRRAESRANAQLRNSSASQPPSLGYASSPRAAERQPRHERAPRTMNVPSTRAQSVAPSAARIARTQAPPPREVRARPQAEARARPHSEARAAQAPRNRQNRQERAQRQDNRPGNRGSARDW